MKPRSAKAKGTKLEKWVVDQLTNIGVPARKQPMSGALQDFPHDVYGELPDGRFIVEAKAWKHGWRTGDNAMGAADCLVMKRDYAAPAVYMSWDFFARLVGLANGDRVGSVSFPLTVRDSPEPPKARTGGSLSPRGFDKPPPGYKHRWPKREVGT